MNARTDSQRERVKAVRLISKHPYDQGYWSRYNGLPMPKNGDKQAVEGWKQCDKELASKSK